MGLFTTLTPGVAAADWTKKDLGNVGGTVFSVATGDGNNDGSDEVYAASSNGGVYQLKQDNDKPKDWKTTTLGYGEGSNFQMRAVIVGDGRDNGKNNVYAGGQDGSWNGKMYEFYNTDSGWQKQQMGTGGWLIFDVALGDGDNDDRDEVYAASYDGRVYEYSYSNGWNSKDIGYSQYYQRGVTVGDADNDGSTEVYSAGGYWTYKHVYQYTYNSSSSSWSQTDLGQPASTWGLLTDIASGDGDNDGNVDLYVTDYSYVYQIIYNSASGTWTWSTIFNNPNFYLNHVEVGDGNADGKNEVYVSSANDQIYKLTYNSGNWAMESIGSGNGDMYGLYVGNGDNFKNQVEVYGGCADSHIYQFMVDMTPPPNPFVWSPTHTPGEWSNISNVQVNWKRSPDPSGIDGYSFIWDTNANTIPDDTKDVEETVSKTESGPLADGDKYYFHIRARDNALNWNPGATHFGPLKIDTVEPTDLDIKINGDATYTNDRMVTLTLNGTDGRSGMGFMAFSNDGTTWPDFDNWEPWNTTRTNWDITDLDFGGNNNDGSKTVYMKARDASGNVANFSVKDDIILDRAKPVGLSIKINDGEIYTNKANVTLNLSASDPDPASGMYQMKFSNDNVNWSAWETWTNIRSGWSLVSDAGGVDQDGTKTVYFKVKDRAGNEAGPMEDDIIMDRSAPGSLSLVINGGERYTNITNVQLNISAKDSSPGTGLDKMQFSNDGTDWSSWEDFIGSKNPWSLTVGAGGLDTDGNKTVYMRVKDHVGNIGGPTKDTIFLDRARPIGLSMSINGGKNLTGKVDVVLTLSAVDPEPGSGIFEMQIKEEGGAWGDWVPWTTSYDLTLSSGDGTKTVYFRVKDNAGNIAAPASDSIVLDTTAPIITNIKVIGITDVSGIVVWTTDSPADSTVDYGSDVNYGNQQIDDSLVSDHSITLTGLTSQTMYHFRVTSTDEVGNGPTVSADHTFKTAATADTTPPIITNVRVEGITDTFAIVLWDTNEPADSMIHYGETTSYDLLLGSVSHVQKHSISLTGLKSDTVYYFKVQSTDSSGNGPVEELGQFKTTNAPDTTPPVLTNVQVSGITDTLAVVTWTSDEVADSTVEFGITSSYGTVVTDANFIRDHSLTLPELTPATTYFFIVRSTDPSGNGPTTSAQYSFQTDATPDLSPPLISNVRSSGVTNTMAIITWNTDELADSKVDFGTSVQYGDSSVDLTFTLSHSITLTGLTPSTIYHFRVLSMDLSDNGPSKSMDHTFTTASVEDKEPPIIEWVEVDGLSSNVAVILWKTNEPATSVVEFGLTDSYGEMIKDDKYLAKHSVVLRDLNASTVYHFRVRSTDVSGNGPTMSNDHTFTTLNIVDTLRPELKNITVTEKTQTSATIKWITNEPGNTLVSYGKNGSLDPAIGIADSYLLEHKFTLQDLEPGTTYEFIVYSEDPSGNKGYSSMMNFTTSKKHVEPPTPPQPDPNPLAGDGSLIWWLLLIIIIGVCIGVVFLVMSRRRPPVRTGPGTKGRSRPSSRTDDERAIEVIELEMEDEDIETMDMEGDDGIDDLGTIEMVNDEDAHDWEGDDDLDEMGSLDMEDQTSVSDDIKIGSAIAAVTRGDAAKARSRNVGTTPDGKKKPLKKVKCPTCKTAIPIYSRTQSEIKCPTCGKEGRVRPMGSIPAKVTQSPGPISETVASPLESVLEDVDITPKKKVSPRPRATPARVGARKDSPAQPEKKPMKVLNCSGCKGKVPVYTAKRPVRITCPNCGKAGTLRK